MNTGIETSSTRYSALAGLLRETLRDGTFSPGQLIGSEHDLVRKHGVSRVTVRRSVDLLIKEGLLERRPGKGLFIACPRPAQHTGLIQVVVGNLEWIPCVRAARGCQVAAGASGLQVQIYDAHGSMELDLDLLRRLPESGARGAVIHSLHDRSFAETLYGLHARGFPFVLVDQRLRDLDAPAVVADNRDGGYRLGRHLVGLGHRRIAFLGDLVASSVQDRLAGLRDAVGDAGLPFDRSLVVDVQPGDQLDSAATGRKTAELTRALIARPDRPTAIFASCDAHARAVLTTLRDLGLSVPGDLSLVGFDDDPIAAPPDLGLTTVRQPFEEMGRAAFAILARRIADPRLPAEHAVLPVTVIERSSTAAPKA